MIFDFSSTPVTATQRYFGSSLVFLFSIPLSLSLSNDNLKCFLNKFDNFNLIWLVFSLFLFLFYVCLMFSPVKEVRCASTCCRMSRHRSIISAIARWVFFSLKKKRGGAKDEQEVEESSFFLPYRLFSPFLSLSFMFALTRLNCKKKK